MFSRYRRARRTLNRANDGPINSRERLEVMSSAMTILSRVLMRRVPSIRRRKRAGREDG